MLPDLIVVTDLDATLLDHFDYSYSAAEPALQKLKVLGIPLVLNSSKTIAEMQEIRQLLKLDAPFIVENGAGLLVPEGASLKEYNLGMNRAELLSVIHDLRQTHGFKFTGFADMQPALLAELTGLSKAGAKLAMQRNFTEALSWEDSDAQLQLFREKLQQAGLSLVRGGRFFHVSSAADKGKAVSFLRQYYQREGRTPRFIALGDSENDLPMLAVAEYAVLVKSPVRDFPDFEHPALRRTSEYGPAGWNQAVTSLLNELKENSE